MDVFFYMKEEKRNKNGKKINVLQILVQVYL